MPSKEIETPPAEYKGDDPSIKAALDRVRPITLEEADWSVDPEGRYGIIDGFLAVIDGRENLREALELARELIQLAPIESICVIRNSETLGKSAERIGDVFYHAAFGSEAVIRPDRTLGSRPAKQGTVLVDPDSGRFYLKKPARTNELLDFVRERMKMRIPEFEFRPSVPWSPERNLGEDFKHIFGTAGKVFPEYMSVYLSNGQSTSEPGVMHFDSSYTVKEINTHGPTRNRSYSHLPKGFLKAANARVFEPLPGGVTITASLHGGGSIVRKTDPERYEVYRHQKEDGTLRDNRAFFFDRDETGYQALDGDILIMRSDGWPDDPEGNPRLPVDHCSAIINAYGHTGNHFGRIIGLMSSEVCYLSPQVREYLGMTRLPEEGEYSVPEQA